MFSFEEKMVQVVVKKLVLLFGMLYFMYFKISKFFDEVIDIMFKLNLVE